MAKNNKKGGSGKGKPKGGIVAVCTELVAPIIKEFGLLLWDLRYEKEGAQWYLRAYIDRENGGVTIEDCVDVSRKFNKILDEADPISESYCLQVSSPGIERELRRPEHFERFIGELVNLKFFRAIDGVKEIQGVLQEYSEGTIYISQLSEYEKESDEVEVIGFDKNEVAAVNVLEFWNEEVFDDEDFSDE